ncbi:hypothetical protein PAMP_019802 [Pampus punctatissimus]
MWPQHWSPWCWERGAATDSHGLLADTAECLICSYAGAVRAVTPPAVMRLTDMETPNTLQESQTRVSSSGVDKSAYSATEDPGSISVEELPPCWVSHQAITRNLADLSCGEHLGQVS